MNEQEKQTEQEQASARPAPAHTNGSDNAEERYRYIGFEIFPRRFREFWSSDAEQKQYVEHVKEAHGKFVPLSRSNSIVAAQSMSMFERVVLTISSALLVIAPLLPWFSFSRGDERFVYSGYVLLLKAGTVLEYFSLGPGLLSTAFILLLSLMILSALVGAATLFFLYTGRSDPDNYLRRVHRILVWSYLPIIGWVTFFSISAAPTVMPFGPSFGLSQFTSSLDIASLAGSSTVGLWLPFGALWVNAIKGNDL